MNKLLVKVLVLMVSISLFATACQPQAQTTQPPKEVQVIVTQIVEVAPPPVDYGDIVWLSTQLRPVQEAEKVRGVILDKFPGNVEFIPEDEGPFHDRITAEVQTSTGTVDILGALHGNFSTMAPLDQLQDLTAALTKTAE